MVGIKVDTSPGPDKVLFKVVKELKCYKVIGYIASIMLMSGIVPDTFKKGRTILIYKSDDSNEIRNWRPITVYPILRRIIERTLDKKLKNIVELNPCQRGFTRTPGTFINSSILNGCLQHCKQSKTNLFVALLDISKAFDTIGHAHIERCLETLDIPNKLRTLIINLLIDNEVNVQVNPTEQTRAIKILRGVAQGSSISPTIFNIAINFIIDDLTKEDNCEKYGYAMNQDVSNISCLAFADDIAIICKDKYSLTCMLKLAQGNLEKIGLQLNCIKSKILAFKNGQLIEDNVNISEGSNIISIKKGERIKYLGITIEDEIVMDKNKLINNLTSNINNLTNSFLLKPDQKLNIINQYIWPSLI